MNAINYIYKIFSLIIRYFLNIIIGRVMDAPQDHQDHKDVDDEIISPYYCKPMQLELIRPRLGSRIPKGRSGHRIVCTGSKLLCYGGYSPSQINLYDTPEVCLFRELWKFDLNTRKWELLRTAKKILDTIPPEVASSAVWLEGQALMIYGGTSLPFGYRCSNRLYICNIENFEGLTEIQTRGSAPLPLYGQAILCHGSYLYTVGGTTGFLYTCDIHRLDVRTGEWEDVYISKGNTPQEPSGRYRHELAFDGQNIYILGGGTSDTTYSFASIPAFNIDKRRWEYLACKPDKKSSGDDNVRVSTGVPESRRCHGCVQIKTDKDIEVYISGGYDGEKEFGDLWKLELSTLQWTCLQATFPKPVFFHCAAVTPDGCMYIFGGISEGKRTNDIHRIWLNVPRLSSMCWDALLHYKPDLPSIPKERLVQYGIPYEFVNRISN